jgi:peptidoglycan/xylan/chitin deacetylase (PgdA/CDA1 family)
MSAFHLRRLAKCATATMLHAAGIDRWIADASGRAREPLILCYHRVISDQRGRERNAPAMLVRRSTLARQLDWIGRRYRFAGLDEVAGQLVSGERAKRPLAAVTFDDGYADAYENAFPLLWRKGIPAAFFLVTDLLGTERCLDHDELYFWLRERAAEAGGWARVGAAARRAGLEWRRVPDAGAPGRVVDLKEALVERLPQHRLQALIHELRRGARLPAGLREELRPMTWSMVRELAAAGAVIGSHTRSHPVLVNQSRAELAVELAGSKRALEAALDREVLHLSYPVGGFNSTCVEAAVAAGYRYAYGTCRHRSTGHPALTLPRQVIWERSWAGLSSRISPAVASCEIAGVFDRLRPCRLDHETRPEQAPRLAWRAAL